MSTKYSQLRAVGLARLRHLWFLENRRLKTWVESAESAPFSQYIRTRSIRRVALGVFWKCVPWVEQHFVRDHIFYWWEHKVCISKLGSSISKHTKSHKSHFWGLWKNDVATPSSTPSLIFENVWFMWLMWFDRLGADLLSVHSICPHAKNVIPC